jgi:hypothetical protein
VVKKLKKFFHHQPIKQILRYPKYKEQSPSFAHKLWKKEGG